VRYLLYSEFLFQSSARAFEAFKNIGRGSDLFSAPGLLQTKMMGTGSGTGFSIWPDFKRYVILSFFESEQSAMDFLIKNQQYSWYLSNADQHMQALLVPFKGHGSWTGEVPFDYDNSVLTNSDPLAVITRATIRTKALPDFWRNVPKVSSFMHSAPALHQIGIGEYPIFMQATFSIWKNLKSLKETAYTNTPHAEVVKKTRERNWYKEELFAEFALQRLSMKGEKFKKLRILNINPF
jgi:hypothetical protein